MVYVLTADAKKIAAIVHRIEYQAPHRQHSIVSTSAMESNR